MGTPEPSIGAASHASRNAHLAAAVSGEQAGKFLLPALLSRGADLKGGAVGLYYRFAYGIGFRPWEQDSAKMTAQIGSLFAREETGREPPYGLALDLGCGTGPWAVLLAQRGWRVVGIDLIPKAVRAARHRAQAAGVDIRFLEGDVTALREAGVGTGFRFLLDVECFNWLNDDQRTAMGQEVDAVASDDAALLVLVWARARRGPMPRGANREDLATAFPGWHITDEEPYAAELPRPLRNIDPHWFRLTRN